MQRRNMLVTCMAAGLAVLACALAAAWLTLDGQLRNTRWQLPQAVTIDITALVPDMPQSQAWHDEQLLAQLQQRPLFILGRKPLPSAKKNTEAAAPDFWDQVQLFGTFEGRKSGAILMAQGKEQRLMLRQSLGGWTLVRILPRQIELEKDGVTRRLELHKAPLDTGPDPELYGAPPARPVTAGPGAALAQQEPPPKPEQSQPVFGGTRTGK